MSKLVGRRIKEDPRDAQIISHKYIIRGGYARMVSAGIYSLLPIAMRITSKIETIIREEMNAIGGQELIMTTLQDPELWKRTGRWDDKIVDNWFKSELASGGEVGIANTHEEVLTRILTNYVSSYKDLPLYAYQFQTKFRNELRAKSGIMRSREFLMKDLYNLFQLS